MDAIRTVERDGWYFVRQRGSHRHFKHPIKRGTVTVSGQGSQVVPKGTWARIMQQAGLKVKW